MIAATIFFISVAIAVMIALIPKKMMQGKKKTPKPPPEPEIIELGKRVADGKAYIIVKCNKTTYYVQIYNYLSSHETPKIFSHDENGDIKINDDTSIIERFFKEQFKERLQKIKEVEEARKIKKIEEFKSKFITYDEQIVKDIVE